LGCGNCADDLRTKIAVTGWLISVRCDDGRLPVCGFAGQLLSCRCSVPAVLVGRRAHRPGHIITWARKRGQFTDANAPLFFQGILVLLAVLMTAYLVNFRVISSGWAKDDVIYPQWRKNFSRTESSRGTL
jgi:hypothetical protein